MAQQSLMTVTCSFCFVLSR